MFKTWLQKLNSAVNNPAPFDPAKFGDSVASKIAWTPVKSGGANFRTQKLVKVSPYRIEFRASVEAKFFYSGFLLLGLGAIIGFSCSNFSGGTFSFNPKTIMPLVMGAVFCAIGGLMLYFGTMPMVFDKMRGCFWKGRQPPGEMIDKTALKHYSEFSRIYALQIISELCQGKSNYYSYELNLVLDDGQRINIADHGNLQKLREDAKTLSEFLGKPLWDATI